MRLLLVLLSVVFVAGERNIFQDLADKAAEFAKSVSEDYGVAGKPRISKFAETARWLVSENYWGSISTISVHRKGAPFAQPKSFVDGGYPSNSTGILYFYDSEMDTSMEDIAADNRVALSLSAASLNHCPPTKHTDPENPTCARVVLSGRFVKVEDENERQMAQASLFARHPIMPRWPEEHGWGVYKINLEEVWLIDIYGGAKSVDINEYLAVDWQPHKSLF